MISRLPNQREGTFLFVQDSLLNDFMNHRYAFYFDSSSCSGCKACQIACKDKNHLPLDINWRQVLEVSGGSWVQSGKAWLSSTYAYNISISCNHCASPICLEVCPSRAITKRHDGIVLIDQSKCLGCRYCSWACPYGALHYNPAFGGMTKCDFCVDQIDLSLPPACVAACPLRALDYGDLSDLEARHGPLPQLDPLPDKNHTQPALLLTPHKDARQRKLK